MSATPFGLYIVGALFLAMAGGTALLALRGRQPRTKPIINASFKELQDGWYQVCMTVTNRAPHGLIAVSLRRVRPLSARLMAPVISSITKQGDFQVWSDPAIDKRTTTISLDTVLGPHQPLEGIASLDFQAQIPVWLFLPKKGRPGPVTLELTLAGPSENLHRYRFLVTPEARHAS